MNNEFKTNARSNYIRKFEDIYIYIYSMAPFKWTHFLVTFSLIKTKKCVHLNGAIEFNKTCPTNGIFPKYCHIYIVLIYIFVKIGSKFSFKHVSLKTTATRALANFFSLDSQFSVRVFKYYLVGSKIILQKIILNLVFQYYKKIFTERFAHNLCTWSASLCIYLNVLKLIIRLSAQKINFQI